MRNVIRAIFAKRNLIWFFTEVYCTVQYLKSVFWPSTWASHVLQPRVAATCSSHVFQPRIPVTCSSHVFQPRVPVTCASHVFQPRVPVTCSSHVFQPRVPVTCSSHVIRNAEKSKGTGKKLVFNTTWVDWNDVSTFQSWSRIHERTISLRFLGILMRVLRLGVSSWHMQRHFANSMYSIYRSTCSIYVLSVHRS